MYTTRRSAIKQYHMARLDAVVFEERHDHREFRVQGMSMKEAAICAI
jgi:hypothetical protein